MADQKQPVPSTFIDPESLNGDEVAGSEFAARGAAALAEVQEVLKKHDVALGSQLVYTPAGITSKVVIADIRDKGAENA